jgi:hypothetical protein
MRRIGSKAEDERKEKIKRRIVGISLLSIMVLSVFGIMISSIGVNKNNPGQITYKGTIFLNQQERWFFSKSNIEFTIMNSPENLTEIPMENMNPIDYYSGKPLYLSSTDKSLESEVYYNLQSIASRIQSGCLNNTKCDGDFPIKTCEDNFIIIEESNETSITQDLNCVFLKAPKQNIQKALDSFFLKIIGIN